jgi:hypothetical protein
MFLKMIAGLMIVAGLVGGTWGSASYLHQTDRSATSANCCLPPQACCDTTCCDADADCCYPAQDCCFGGVCCTAAKKTADCCASGDACCSPAAECCLAGK